MSTKSLSATDAIKFGWQTFKKSPLFWIIISIISVILGGGVNFNNQNDMNGGVETNLPVGAILLIVVLGLAFFYISYAFQLGRIKVELNAVDNKELKYKDLFSFFPQFKRVLKLVVATILYSLVVAFGLILLIIPGIYFAIKFGFYIYAITDKDSGILESFNISSEITKGVKLDLLVLVIISFGVMILGLLALLVGMFVAMPVIYIAWAYTYRTLDRQISGIDIEPVAPAPSSADMNAPQVPNFQTADQVPNSLGGQNG